MQFIDTCFVLHYIFTFTETISKVTLEENVLLEFVVRYLSSCCLSTQPRGQNNFITDELTLVRLLSRESMTT